MQCPVIKCTFQSLRINAKFEGIIPMHPSSQFSPLPEASPHQISVTVGSLYLLQNFLEMGSYICTFSFWLLFMQHNISEIYLLTYCGLHQCSLSFPSFLPSSLDGIFRWTDIFNGYRIQIIFSFMLMPFCSLRYLYLLQLHECIILYFVLTAFKNLFILK